MKAGRAQGARRHRGHPRPAAVPACGLPSGAGPGSGAEAGRAPVLANRCGGKDRNCRSCRAPGAEPSARDAERGIAGLPAAGETGRESRGRGEGEKDARGGSGGRTGSSPRCQPPIPGRTRFGSALAVPCGAGDVLGRGGRPAARPRRLRGKGEENGFPPGRTPAAFFVPSLGLPSPHSLAKKKKKIKKKERTKKKERNGGGLLKARLPAAPPGPAGPPGSRAGAAPSPPAFSGTSARYRPAPCRSLRATTWCSGTNGSAERAPHAPPLSLLQNFVCLPPVPARLLLKPGSSLRAFSLSFPGQHRRERCPRSGRGCRQPEPAGNFGWATTEKPRFAAGTHRACPCVCPAGLWNRLLKTQHTSASIPNPSKRNVGWRKDPSCKRIAGISLQTAGTDRHFLKIPFSV